MYRIKFPSGEVATIDSPEALTEAVRSGSVTSYCFILHERTGQWLPIVRHPHYHRALTARGPAPAAGTDVAPILPDPLDLPVAATKVPAQPQRTTAISLDPPNFDELLEMMDTAPAPAAALPAEPSAPSAPAAAAPPPAAEPPRPRARSRELEFLYVPESKAAGQPRTPRTAGPPPRAQTPGQKPAPASTPAPSATPSAKSAPSIKPPPAPGPRDGGPKAEAPTAPAPPRMAEPPRATQPPVRPTEPMLQADPVRAEPAGSPARPEPSVVRTEPAVAPPEPVVARPEPTLVRPEPTPVRPEPVVARPEPKPVRPEPVREPEPVRPTAVAPAAAPVATLAPPRRKAERYDRDLIDPVEAALSLEGPAPIELRLPVRRHDSGGSRRLFVLAGLAVLLGGGILTWSPWSGAAREAAAATSAREAPAKPAASRAEAAPAADPVYDMEAPAEEEPVIDLYSVSPDGPYSARTSFGGTAAQAGAAVPEAPAPDPAAIPRKPKTIRVAVPVVGSTENPDSAKLAAVKRAITQ